MKQTLIHKYIAGETTIDEELELKRLLLSVPQSQLSKEERTILELLSFTDNNNEEEDIFAVDYTEEYDKTVHPTRAIRFWPWAVAVCMAGMLIIFLAPPKKETQQLAKVERIHPKHSTYVSEQEIKPDKKAQTTVGKQITTQMSHKKHSIIKSTSSNEFSEQFSSTVTEQDEVDEEIAFEDKIVAELHDDLKEQMQMCDIECFNNKISRKGKVLTASIQEKI